MSEVLSELALNRAVLGRQLLLARSTASLTEALDQIAGIQNQYAPNGYIGLWSRLAGFTRESLTNALESRAVVQGTTLRGTIHLVTPEFFNLSNNAVREHRLEWWLRATRTKDAEGLRATAQRIARVLDGGARKRGELMKELAIDTATWNGATSYLDLIRVPPSGTWDNRRADRYETFPTEPVDPAVALQEMISRYLQAFGPASAQDISTFLGLKVGVIKPLLGEYRQFRREDGEELFDIVDGMLPDPDTDAPPRFLPPWEASLLVHARRSGILPEKYRPLIFNTKLPQSVPTFLIDGRVAGTWALDPTDLCINPFQRLDRPWATALADEAERLRAFIA